MRKAVITFIALMSVVGAVVLIAPRGSGELPADLPATSVSTVSSDDQQTFRSLAALDQARFRALAERDPTLLAEVFTPSGPAMKAVRRTIENLIRDKIQFRLRRYDVISEEVVSRRADTIVIRQQVIVDYDFISLGGENREAGKPEQQTLTTVLKNVSGEWLFHKGTIESAEPLDD